MNFGHPYWTTNHSVVNFMLNVLDFHPDFVVIHHGWNEERARNFPPGESEAIIPMPISPGRNRKS
jgi:hypothetical protein